MDRKIRSIYSEVKRTIDSELRLIYGDSDMKFYM